MEYSKTYISKDECIDIQEIIDGLYYPFYMAYCRHDYIREVLGFDFETEAKSGVSMVLSNSLNFMRSLKRGDQFKVSYTLYEDKDRLPELPFKQKITCNHKLIAAYLTANCVLNTITKTKKKPYRPKGIAKAACAHAAGHC